MNHVLDCLLPDDSVDPHWEALSRYLLEDIAREIGPDCTLTQLREALARPDINERQSDFADREWASIVSTARVRLPRA